jgi:hypothetical protein
LERKRKIGMKRILIMEDYSKMLKIKAKEKIIKYIKNIQ